MMNFVACTNIATALFCAAVLIQSVRMMRSLKAMRNAPLSDVVAALDASTERAKTVLSEMKTMLSHGIAANGRCSEDARKLSDELRIIIEIADAAADRIVEATSAANQRAHAERTLAAYIGADA
ncbi:MAG: DUF6468 domain-containing protein [Sphingomonas sp.]|jgi:hypothetical protein|uniref:DUF6468 domain-containing protein n=1 Tax=unclassified Sphingomonas TaxID=196159 RepID=UPI000F8966A7|nr:MULTISPECIES: DUF6468 domain-containing protein [unclassified Sphingomonas]MCP4027555.1 hypothetical protein [Sphingomonas sp.]MDR6848585.1 hypothetical protein [Sphingomonas sp. BE137]MDR7255866.1 hypothetical protein [Sphingomonas sp. BE270]RUN76140.1 hypothetical protein EJC47_12190 [Sphingomonas sp. TF3]